MIRASSLALNPWLGVEFILTHGLVGLVVMGLVFLVATGAEALYADLGHFGRKPIQVAWLWHRPAGADAQLLRPGRAAAGPSRTPSRIPSTGSIPELGADPDGGAGDGGNRHRQPGRDHRRLLLHAPGDPARAAAAPGDPPHLRERCRADLSAARQPDPARRRAAGDAHLPHLERPRCGLRRVGDRNDGDRQPDGVLRGLALLEVAGVEGRRC